MRTARMAKGAPEFRAELEKLMPGYQWTVHKSYSENHIEATGTKSSGFNRLCTLSVIRTEHTGAVMYEVKSAGYGLRAPWLHTHADKTLARALRGLQDHYEAKARTYLIHADDLASGRKAGSAA